MTHMIQAPMSSERFNAGIVSAMQKKKILGVTCRYVIVAKQRAGGKQMILYWVTTEDHYEDWFVFAASPEEATRYFENYEGYNEGDAEAEEILELSDDLQVEAGWPDKELLEKLGFVYLSDEDDHTRVVEFCGRRFIEGAMEAIITKLNDGLIEKQRGERPNKTKKSPLQ